MQADSLSLSLSEAKPLHRMLCAASQKSDSGSFPGKTAFGRNLRGTVLKCRIDNLCSCLGSSPFSCATIFYSPKKLFFSLCAPFCNGCSKLLSAI